MSIRRLKASTSNLNKVIILVKIHSEVAVIQGTGVVQNASKSVADVVRKALKSRNGVVKYSPAKKTFVRGLIDFKTREYLRLYGTLRTVWSAADLSGNCSAAKLVTACVSITAPAAPPTDGARARVAIKAGRATVTWYVLGMHCPACVWLLERLRRVTI